MTKTTKPSLLAFTVLTGPWHADGEAYVDVCQVEDPSDELVKLAAGAHAAGAIVVTEGLVEHAQSQEDGEAAQVAAQESGDWQIGNVLQHRLEQALGRVAVAEVAVDAEQDGSDAEIEAAKAELAEVEADIGALTE